MVVPFGDLKLVVVSKSQIRIVNIEEETVKTYVSSNIQHASLHN